ncbi:trans-1,2-dihydrobenzene-1,2-diol dehydrogenase [Chloropicon primus]|uniref:D-xylose 1-dehydrogenase (NADP(+), D-xylono-1,5-lactone-forming) n=1 Tax=Chloropicon primus TaxID=1764295 RepID=A0A7S2X1F9_9CHLO|nr:trans-1,2-dihydrobenzene-1,2-diol dehydrogenase [Chloropicon primus]|mmetsp:Transcript_6866/g.20063  ORF Transcript_6866/g.20063 Transcript_6866/m.20063 type:complete len:343 (+) Transcript_6866:75-1103(+)
MKDVRWGIAGCGKISHDFTNALTFNKSNVVACAARSETSSKRFAETFGIPKHYGGYDGLLEDGEVDVVYIGTIHTTHCELVMKALDKGKHVLCEKPIGMNGREVRKMVALAKEKNLFLMEGMWTRCFPATRKIASLLETGELGEVITCTADLGFSIPFEVKRLYELEMGGGGLLDLGVYPLAWLLLAFGDQELKSVNACASLHESGADMTGVITLRFGKEGVGSASYSSRSETQKELHINCTKGSIRVRGCWSSHTPERVEVRRDEAGEADVFEFPIEKNFPVPMNFGNSEGFVNECRHVEECLRGGKLESNFWSLQETLKSHDIVDEIRKMLGVTYPQDQE